MKPIYSYIIFTLLLISFSCKQLEIKRINKVETLWSNFENNQIIAKGNIIDVVEGGITDYGFCYAPNKSFPTINDDRISLGATNKTGEFSANLLGLQAFNVYHFRAYAISNNVVTYGKIYSTDVSPNVLNISIDSLNIISSKQINLSASFNGIGDLKILDFGYNYSLQTNPNLLTNKQSLGALKKDTVFSAKILNPIIDTTYYVKAYAQLSNTAYFHSAEKTVRISSFKIRTGLVGQFDANTAFFIGYIDNLGADTIQEYGICYSTTTSFPTLNDNKLIVTKKPTTGTYSSNAPLVLGNTYFARAYAIIDNKIIYGQVESKSF
jgi:hypothetical protein